MDRRRFLKLAGLVSLAAGVQVFVSGAAPRVAMAASRTGKLYRGDRMGKIYASRDSGASWQLHTNLGPEYSVTRLGRQRGGRVGTTVIYRGREFKLALSDDERSWRTV
jgi:hypothetical protein